MLHDMFGWSNGSMSSHRAFQCFEPWQLRCGNRTLTAQQLLSEGIFWSWVGTRLNRVFPNATSRPAPFLEIEVWATGGRSLDLGVQSLAGAASWESACLQVLCFCGTMECRTADSWFNLGSLEVALGNPGLNESEGNASDALVEALGDVVNVSFAWGIQVSSEPLSATDGGLSYSRSLVLEDLWSQRQLLAFCEGTAPNLVVVRRNCWPIDFKCGGQVKHRNDKVEVRMLGVYDAAIRRVLLPLWAALRSICVGGYVEQPVSGQRRKVVKVVDRCCGACDVKFQLTHAQSTASHTRKSQLTPSATGPKSSEPLLPVTSKSDAQVLVELCDTWELVALGLEEMINEVECELVTCDPDPVPEPKRQSGQVGLELLNGFEA
ncbi:unnamed protein product [Effrenium voratum]|nr:unnamed protein product [Effrenium voratum]